MNSALKHVVDFVTVRFLGVCLIAHETVHAEESEWAVLSTGVFLVLAPDAARGRASLLADVVRIVTGRGTPPASSEETP